MGEQIKYSVPLPANTLRNADGTAYQADTAYLEAIVRVLDRLQESIIRVGDPEGSHNEADKLMVELVLLLVDQVDYPMLQGRIKQTVSMYQQQCRLSWLYS